ncbi:MAG: lipoyl(octanoyl) transferase LipB [Cellvibrionaceae bacterium]
MPQLCVRRLGMQPYQQTWQAMSDFTDRRDEHTLDELWLVQHPPVYTQGQAGKPEHLINPGDIPVIQSDRGGQVTYHGPGQLIAYPLINLRRRKMGVRDMVTLLEEVAVELLASYDIEAYPKPDAPGVYVVTRGQEAKIASLGLRVRKGCCFHGISINIDMDLSPFDRINPCGYAGLPMTQLKDLGEKAVVDYTAIEQSTIQLIANKLNVSEIEYDDTLPMR